ncbi:hypothetical protein SK128_008922 [Halocaridina rubra]|uniref:Uncharacterized protein n=1 Tax=Halocaridina rubra TaxID=373956 RepID=A0AAN8WG25_HALRR
MAGDYMQSNLFNPTAPTEQYLQRLKIRRRRLDDEALSSRCSLDGQSNNNNIYSVQDYNKHKSSKRVARDKFNSKSTQTAIAKHPVTKPMINSLLAEGIVKLPGPPSNPRYLSNTSNGSSLEPRRDRVRKNCRQNFHQEPILFTAPREILQPEAPLQDRCDILQPLRNGSPDIRIHSDTSTQNGIDDSPVSKDTDVQIPNLSEPSTKCTEKDDFTSNRLDLALSSPPTKEIVKLEQDNYPVSAKIDSNFAKKPVNQLNNMQKSPSTLKILKDENRSCIKSIITESVVAGDSFNLLQIQTELERLKFCNQMSERNIANENKLNKINSSVFRESLVSSAREQSNNMKIISNENHEVGLATLQPEAPGSTTQIFSSQKKKSKFRKKLMRRKQLLQFLQLAFGRRWVKATRNDDEEFLVDEEPGVENQTVVTKKNRKKRKKNKEKQDYSKEYTPDHKAKVKMAVYPHEAKDAKNKTSSIVKKRKRLRKKNLTRARRRLRRNFHAGCYLVIRGLISISHAIPEGGFTDPRRRGTTHYHDYEPNTHFNPRAPSWDKDKRYPIYDFFRKIHRSLGYGCRYIGHGLVNMTSIIPEVSYMGPVGHSRTFPTEYVHNDYYDPSAPLWHSTKGPYIANPYK